MRKEKSNKQQSTNNNSLVAAEHSRNLQKILQQELTNSFKGERGRAQSGFFHVWFRGSNRYNVFYADEDFIEFLKRCNIASAKHNSAITAFVIMNNHVHLQVYSNNLSLFITSILITFSRWLNKRKSLRGKLFESPFNSYQLFTEEAVKKNLLYIITNPVNAGICDHIKDYKWSSYHFIKTGFHNHLREYLKIDTTIMKSFFGSTKEISIAAQNYLIQKHNYNHQLDGSNSNSPNRIINSKDYSNAYEQGVNRVDGQGVNRVNGQRVSKIDSQGVSKIDGQRVSKIDGQRVSKVKLNDSELSSILSKILIDKELWDLSRNELIGIVKILKDDYNATFRQIAALTHESYDDVRRMTKFIHQMN